MFPRMFRFGANVVYAGLAFSPPAHAEQSPDFSNSGGTMSGVDAGLSLTGSTLVSMTAFSGTPITGDLGNVSFTTGVLMGGSLQMGGTFAGGGSLTVDGTETNSAADGVLFAGAFSGPLTWTLTTLANGTHNYTLTAVVTGTMGSTPVPGVTVQLTVDTGKGLFNGSTSIAGGDTTVSSSVPEPSTLALLSTGLLAMGGGVRRRIIG